MQTQSQLRLVVSKEFNSKFTELFEAAARSKLAYTPDATELVGSAMQCSYFDGQLAAYDAIRNFITTQP